MARPKGSRNIRHILATNKISELEDVVMKSFRDVMNETGLTKLERFEAAVKIAPYLFPKKQAIELNATMRSIEDELDQLPE